MASNVLFPEILQSLAHGSISSSYTLINQYPDALRIFRLINATDGDMIFSFDGANDHFFVPAGSFVLYDIAGNSGQSSNARIRANTPVYVRYSTSPSQKSVYVEGIYGVANNGFGS